MRTEINGDAYHAWICAVTRALRENRATPNTQAIGRAILVDFGMHATIQQCETDMMSLSWDICSLEFNGNASIKAPA